MNASTVLPTLSKRGWIWLSIFLMFLILAPAYAFLDPAPLAAQGTVPPGGTLPGGTVPPDPMQAPDFTFGTIHGLTLRDGPPQPAITLLVPGDSGADWVALVTKGREQWGGVKTSCMEFGATPTYDGILGNTYFCELAEAASTVSAILAGEPEDDPEPSLLLAGSVPSDNEVEFWPNCSLWRQPSSDGKKQSCEVSWTVPGNGLLSATGVVIGNDDDSRLLDYTLLVNGIEIETVSYDDPTVGGDNTPTWDLGVNATLLSTDVQSGDEVVMRVASPTADGDSGYWSYARLTLSSTRLAMGVLRDRDQDSIPDIVEGDRDADQDDLQDSLDTDADNDGWSDRAEVGPDPLRPRDSDGNGIPDYKQFGFQTTSTIYFPLMVK